MFVKGVLATIFSVGVITGTAFLGTKTKTSEKPKKSLLTPDKVLGSSTMGELEVYYNYMSELFVTGQIDRVAYEALYQAYVTRFYQLIGANP
jgi:hypothetical protein